MKFYHGRLMALVVAVPSLCCGAAQTSTAAGSISPFPLHAVGLVVRDPAFAGLPWLPVVRALDPEEGRRRMREADDSDRPIARERAFLPNPSNGRELVDRLRAADSRQSPLPGPKNAAARRSQVFGVQRLGPTFVPPLGAGLQ